MSTDSRVAGLARRLAAMFYDSLLLTAIGWAITAAHLGLRVLRSGEGVVRGSAGEDTGRTLLQIALLLAWMLFFCWFWTRSGQTLGMQAWRLRVETLDGRLLDWRTAALRLAGATVSAACLGAGYWWLLFDPERRTWHDRWSGSRVVQLGAN